jgi:hypothetical protein
MEPVAEAPVTEVWKETEPESPADYFVWLGGGD